MSELSELYQQVILDHNKKPRNFRELEGANRTAEGFNPLCGDQLTVYMLMDEGVVRDLSFVGTGCAISKASASMMTQAVKGKTREETLALFDEFHRMVTGELDRRLSRTNSDALKFSRACATTPRASNARASHGTRCTPRSKARSRQRPKTSAQTSPKPRSPNKVSRETRTPPHAALF